jgi:hypothetical protein
VNPRPGGARPCGRCPRAGAAGALPVSLEALRALNPFAVEYRYDDESAPALSREAMAATLAVVMDWAGDAVSG